MKEKTNQNKFREDYESPCLTEQSLHIEGVLCQSPGSGKMSIGDWQDDGDPLTM